MAAEYIIHCPAVPTHSVGWTPIPAMYQSMPLMTPGKPGKNPELVRALQRCPSCIVRFLMKS
ncbi:MAG TPA: hypothetical protein VMG58_17935 [Candidatus Sulfotelmatobacter sp.]|nr:hypothetical protein [Candidatus Sulfotelmatobacter sp.]